MLQTIGRAARNENGKVLLYADGFSPAMEASIRQTLNERRQQANNEALGITPKTIVKALPVMGGKPRTPPSLEPPQEAMGSAALIAKKGGRKDGDWAQRLRLGAGSWGATEKQEKSIEHSNAHPTYDEPDDVGASLSADERAALMEELRQAMNEAAKDLDFEEAARLRDRLHELERWNDRG